MDRKLKGDISEQMVIVEALKRDWDVSIPVGDRLKYDLIFDVNGLLIKVQVKSAYESKGRLLSTSSRNAMSNQRNIVYRYYEDGDFDVAIVVDQESEDFYIIPAEEFLKHRGGSIELRHINPTLAKYDFQVFKNAWSIIEGRLGQECPSDNVPNSVKLVAR